MSGVVRGWCPSAHRPMMSGDGLLVRVKPRLGWLDAAQMHVLCDLAERFGNGLIDLTKNANLQIRGVDENEHPQLLSALIKAGLVAATPELEARRNIVIGSSQVHSGPAEDLASDIEARLRDMPDLPGKMGVAICLGQTLSADVPGDFRFEQSQDGLILRADGAEKGRPVSADKAVDCLLEMMTWFLETGGAQQKRMSRHLATQTLPEEWQIISPSPAQRRATPGPVPDGFIIGIAFGATTASELRSLLETTHVKRIGLTPWRLLRLQGVAQVSMPDFLTSSDPLLCASACPGHPLCSQATVPTRDLARELAAKVDGSLHISGCSKGCARQNTASVTLVGRNGAYDLVRNGLAGDDPSDTSLTKDDVTRMFA